MARVGWLPGHAGASSGTCFSSSNACVWSLNSSSPRWYSFRSRVAENRPSSFAAPCASGTTISPSIQIGEPTSCFSLIIGRQKPSLPVK